MQWLVNVAYEMDDIAERRRAFGRWPGLIAQYPQLVRNGVRNTAGAILALHRGTDRRAPGREIGNVPNRSRYVYVVPDTGLFSVLDVVRPCGRVSHRIIWALTKAT